MKQYYGILKKCVAFNGFTDEELDSVLTSLGIRPVAFAKGATILNQGEKVTHSGIILKGSISAESVSYGGNRRIISVLCASELFGDILMSAENHQSPVNVVAREDSEVLFLSVQELYKNSTNPLCVRVLLNLLGTVSEKFWKLNRKIAYLSSNSLRQRVAMFLLDTHKQKETLTFDIDYSREEMASLLSVNRSALSRELSRMAKEGLISYYRSSFKILDPERLKSCLL